VLQTLLRAGWSTNESRQELGRTWRIVHALKEHFSHVSMHEKYGIPEPDLDTLVCLLSFHVYSAHHINYNHISYVWVNACDTFKSYIYTHSYYSSSYRPHDQTITRTHRTCTLFRVIHIGQQLYNRHKPHVSLISYLNMDMCLACISLIELND